MERTSSGSNDIEFAWGGHAGHIALCFWRSCHIVPPGLVGLLGLRWRSRPGAGQLFRRMWSSVSAHNLGVHVAHAREADPGPYQAGQGEFPGQEVGKGGCCKLARGCGPWRLTSSPARMLSCKRGTSMRWRLGWGGLAGHQSRRTPWSFRWSRGLQRLPSPMWSWASAEMLSSARRRRGPLGTWLSLGPCGSRPRMPSPLNWCFAGDLDHAVDRVRILPLSWQSVPGVLGRERVQGLRPDLAEAVVDRIAGPATEVPYGLCPLLLQPAPLWTSWLTCSSTSPSVAASSRSAKPWHWRTSHSSRRRWLLMLNPWRHSLRRWPTRGSLARSWRRSCRILRGRIG